MKKFLVLLGLVFCGQIAVAQAILTNVSLMGSVSANTQAVQYVRTRGGSPRSGFYYYWRAVIKESTTANVPIALNASTGAVSSTGTFYSQSYTPAGSGRTTFVSYATSAAFSFSGQMSTTVLPTLVAHQA